MDHGFSAMEVAHNPNRQRVGNPPVTSVHKRQNIFISVSDSLQQGFVAQGSIGMDIVKVGGVKCEAGANLCSSRRRAAVSQGES